MTTPLHHPTLNGTLLGLTVSPPSSPSPITHFRGLKYASIPARFSRAVPIDDLAGATVDCSQFGPVCPQLALDVSQMVGLSTRDEPREPQDEFECLTVNVTVPREVLDGEVTEKVPVMVWIHGGGFTTTVGSPQGRYAGIHLIL